MMLFLDLFTTSYFSFNIFEGPLFLNILNLSLGRGCKYSYHKKQAKF